MSVRPLASVPGGADFIENWAAQLLKEKRHAVGSAEVWGRTIKRMIDGIPRTSQEVIRIAAQHPEWEDRKRAFLEHIQEHQASLG